MDASPEAHDSSAAQADRLARERRARTSFRLLGLLILALSGTVLGVAAWLKPSPRGFGTHEQLGAGPCGMLVATGYPCPSCGMTTAFAETLHGHPLRAFWAQPAGFLLALATIALALGALWMIGSGRLPTLNYLAVTPYRLFATLLVLLLVGWGLKVVFGWIDGSLPFRR